MRTYVIVKFQFEGMHQWKDAPSPDPKDPAGPPAMMDITFLRQRHRHIFHVTAKKEVRHDDRDIEFIQLKRQMLKLWGTNGVAKELGGQSCEMIAKKMMEQFNLDYCCVMEDGENGAEIIKDYNMPDMSVCPNCQEAEHLCECNKEQLTLGDIF